MQSLLHALHIQLEDDALTEVISSLQLSLKLAKVREQTLEDELRVFRPLGRRARRRTNSDTLDHLRQRNVKTLSPFCLQ